MMPEAAAPPRAIETDVPKTRLLNEPRIVLGKAILALAF